jgi:hypothetical protein
MMSVESQAHALVQDIEAYLRAVSDILPDAKPGSDLHSYVSAILKRTQYSTLRRAFGFPSTRKNADNLVHVLKSSEPSLTPFVRLIAQRVYQLTWRFMYTLHWIDQPWKADALRKAHSLLGICEPHLLARRPTPPDLGPVLEWGTETGMFRESVVDTQVFAILRAFEYRSEFTDEEDSAPIPPGELDNWRQNALQFLYKYLTRVLTDKDKVADSSNAWWALRVGWEDQKRFGSLLPRLMQKFFHPSVPNWELANRDFAPDIRTELRTYAYTLSNAQAIYENGIGLSRLVMDQLERLIENIARRMIRITRSPNLYLASVHYEALRNYLDYLDDRFFMRLARTGKVKISSLLPVGKFACGDVTLNEQIRELMSQLRAPNAQRGRKLKRIPIILKHSLHA